MPSLRRDQIRLTQGELRPLADNVRAFFFICLRAVLTRGLYAGEVDTELRKALLSDFQHLSNSLDVPASKIRLIHPYTPPPPGEPVAIPAFNFIHTHPFVQENGTSRLLHRSHMWVVISKRPHPAAASSPKDGNWPRPGKTSAAAKPPRPTSRHSPSTFLNRLIHVSTPKIVCAEFYVGLPSTPRRCDREHTVRHPNPRERWISFAGHVPQEVQQKNAAVEPPSPGHWSSHRQVATDSR